MHSFVFFLGGGVDFFCGNRVCVKNDKCYFAVLEIKGDGWNRTINISVFIVYMSCVLS